MNNTLKINLPREAMPVDTLSAHYTVSEVQDFLKEVNDELGGQAPYFDARLLNRKEQLEKALFATNQTNQ